MHSHRRFFSGSAIILTSLFVFSCNLNDFNLNELAKPVNVVPTIYLPLAYGTFQVDHLVTATVADNFQIPSSGWYLDQYQMDKTNVYFSNVAIDSVYLENRITNNTPCGIELNFSFYDSLSGLPSGRSYASGKIAPGAQDTIVQYRLGRIDQNDIMYATDIILTCKLSNTTLNPIYFGSTKKTSFSMKLGFHAPANIWKLTN